MGLGFILSPFALIHYRKIIFGLTAWPLWLFLGIYPWALIHLIFFSANFDIEARQLSSVFLRCLAVTPLGLSLGLLLTTQQPEDQQARQPKGFRFTHGNSTIMLMLIGLSGPLIIGTNVYLYEAWRIHQLLNFEILATLYKAKAPFVISSAVALPLCFIWMIRAINQQMSIGLYVASFFVFLCSLLVAFFSDSKNAILINLLCFTIFIINLTLKMKFNRRYFIFLITFLLMVSIPICTVTTLHIDKNKFAWSEFTANLEVALDIDNHNYWKNRLAYSLPYNKFDHQVDMSSYERTAWFVVGLRLLKENPMGYGLLHHSFGSLAAAKWPDFYRPNGNTRGATHSGWLDFGLAMGIPGLLFVLIPLFASWYRSALQSDLWSSYAFWTIPILSFAYLTTEVSEKHFIEMLFFMVAFFCGLTLQHQRSNTMLKPLFSNNKD